MEAAPRAAAGVRTYIWEALVPGRSKAAGGDADRGRAAGEEAGQADESKSAASPARPAQRRARKRGAQAANTADGVVFAIYTRSQERERYRALAEKLKVTHGELLSLLLDMTEDMLASGQLEVRFTTVTVRKTKPEYVLKTPRSGGE
jgi:hypothetical protein